MREKDKREVLTKEVIELEIKNEYKKLIGYMCLALVFCMICFIVCVALIKDIVGLGFALLLLAIDVGILAYIIRLNMRRNANPLEYTIVTDRFTGFKMIMSRRYFCFEKHGAYLLPEPGATFYKYSKYYPMDYFKLRQTSIVGDEFYLILVKKKIFYIYNTQYFKLED
ncbi:MAG: hypothetical protein IJY79_06190 [Clostridia bacterium]|nr:hypothetical protein [Clostridia bacterium]